MFFYIMLCIYYVNRVFYNLNNLHSPQIHLRDSVLHSSTNAPRRGMSFETSVCLWLNILCTFPRDISVHEIGTEFPLRPNCLLSRPLRERSNGRSRQRSNDRYGNRSDGITGIRVIPSAPARSNARAKARV